MRDHGVQNWSESQYNALNVIFNLLEDDILCSMSSSWAKENHEALIITCPI